MPRPPAARIRTMPKETLTQLEFGSHEAVDGSLSTCVRGLVGSEILKIGAQIRAMIAEGKSVCNLTVGDFDPKQFPIPEPLLEGIRAAYTKGETNYPPSDGMPALRKAVSEFTARTWGVRYPVESVLIASGARPILYGAYRCVVNPGDTVVYPTPSWNNNHYVWLTGAKGVPIATHVDDGFQPTLEMLRPHVSTASMIVLNTPLNPSGTVMEPTAFRAILQAIVEENRKRERDGRRHLFLLFDQVYGTLVFGGARHDHPAALLPEVAPWVITVDGISKAFASTGLRVGWVLAAPAVTARMRDLIGHIGAWAPRPEQVAVAAFLDDENAVAAFRREMDARLIDRLDALHHGFTELAEAGYPVACVRPQGAIYLSLGLDLIGRKVDGVAIETNETIRRLLLERAGMAVVPFQAFGLEEETGWFRISVGAVSMEDIRAAFPRVKALLDSVGD